MEYQELSQRVEDAFEGMSAQLKRAARYVLDHPDDVALLSMRQFATQADVHPSTMMRLVKELGLDGYAAFQEPHRHRLRTRPEENFSGDARSIQKRGSSSREVLLDDLLDTERANLLDLQEKVGYSLLIECADQIRSARRVYVCGARSSYPAAFYFHYAYRMFNDNIRLLDGHGDTSADNLRGIGPDDVLLAISVSPYSRMTQSAVNYASSQGASVIAMTDSPVSPMVKEHKAKAIVLSTKSPSLFRSVVPAMTAVQALLLLLLGEGGEDAIHELSATEAQLKAFGVYRVNGKVVT